MVVVRRQASPDVSSTRTVYCRDIDSSTWSTRVSPGATRLWSSQARTGDHAAWDGSWDAPATSRAAPETPPARRRERRERGFMETFQGFVLRSGARGDVGRRQGTSGEVRADRGGPGARVRGAEDAQGAPGRGSAPGSAPGPGRRPEAGRRPSGPAGRRGSSPGRGWCDAGGRQAVRAGRITRVWRNASRRSPSSVWPLPCVAFHMQPNHTLGVPRMAAPAAAMVSAE